MNQKDKFNEFENSELSEFCLNCKTELNFNEIQLSQYCGKCDLND